MSLENYIGIPYVSHGRGFEGCDCYGLVKLFMKNEMGKEIPEIDSYSDADAKDEVWGLVMNNRPLITGDKKQKPDYGDVVLMKFKGLPIHLGVYVGRNRVLHILKGINSMIIPIDHPLIRGRIEGYYGIK